MLLYNISINLSLTLVFYSDLELKSIYFENIIKKTCKFL